MSWLAAFGGFVTGIVFAGVAGLRLLRDLRCTNAVFYGFAQDVALMLSSGCEPAKVQAYAEKTRNVLKEYVR